jgi:hypothetical protein
MADCASLEAFEQRSRARKESTVHQSKTRKQKREYMTIYFACFCAGMAASPSVNLSFFVALRSGDIRHVKEALTNGRVDRDHAVDTTGDTIVAAAMESGAGAMLDTVLSCGANVNVATRSGLRPLVIAASKSHGDLKDGPDPTVRQLLEAGADRELVNTCDGRSCLHTSSLSPETLQLLLAPSLLSSSSSIQGSDAKTSSNGAPFKADRLGTFVNAVDNSGRTPLFYAAGAVDPPSREDARVYSVNDAMAKIRLLLASGAGRSINFCDHEARACVPRFVFS